MDSDPRAGWVQPAECARGILPDGDRFADIAKAETMVALNDQRVREWK
jgi:hypothetical protein